MYEILKNKQAILLIIVALIIGGLIGGLLRPAHEHNLDGPVAHQHDEAAEEIWTCSMHPQIRQSEPGQCPICGMDLIPASSGVSPPLQIRWSMK